MKPTDTPRLLVLSACWEVRACRAVQQQASCNCPKKGQKTREKARFCPWQAR